MRGRGNELCKPRLVDWIHRSQYNANHRVDQSQYEYQWIPSDQQSQTNREIKLTQRIYPEVHGLPARYVLVVEAHLLGDSRANWDPRPNPQRVPHNHTSQGRSSPWLQSTRVVFRRSAGTNPITPHKSHRVCGRRQSPTPLHHHKLHNRLGNGNCQE